MSDARTLLLALLRPLVRGRNILEAEAWGLRLVGPERTERLAHGIRPHGLLDSRGQPWPGPAWGSEAEVLRDLEDLGWTLVERRPRSHDVTVLTLARPEDEVIPDQWAHGRPTGLIKRRVRQFLAQRLSRPDVGSAGTWPHVPQRPTWGNFARGRYSSWNCTRSTSARSSSTVTTS